MKLTTEGFVKFVMAQPADKEIDNDGSWCNCAVGEYAGVDTEDSSGLYFDGFDELAKLGEKLKPIFPCIAENQQGKNPYKTYGHMQEFVINERIKSEAEGGHSI